MKAWTFRLPEDLLEWLRHEAGLRTSQSEYVVSMNALAVEILSEAREQSESYQQQQAKKKEYEVRKAAFEARKADRKKGGE